MIRGQSSHRILLARKWKLYLFYSWLSKELHITGICVSKRKWPDDKLWMFLAREACCLFFLFLSLPPSLFLPPSLPPSFSLTSLVHSLSRISTTAKTTKNKITNASLANNETWIRPSWQHFPWVEDTSAHTTATWLMSVHDWKTRQHTRQVYSSQCAQCSACCIPQSYVQISHRSNDAFTQENEWSMTSKKSHTRPY